MQVDKLIQLRRYIYTLRSIKFECIMSGKRMLPVLVEAEERFNLPFTEVITLTLRCKENINLKKYYFIK